MALPFPKERLWEGGGAWAHFQAAAVHAQEGPSSLSSAATTPGSATDDRVGWALHFSGCLSTLRWELCEDRGLLTSAQKQGVAWPVSLRGPETGKWPCAGVK